MHPTDGLPWPRSLTQNTLLGRICLQIAVGIWVSYVTSCYVTSCSVCPGSSVALGGEWGECRSISLLFENSILLIKVQGYRGLTEKLKTVKTVHTSRYSVLKIREYFRGVVFCDSFGIYCAASHGIWCSATCYLTPNASSNASPYALMPNPSSN